MYMPGRLRTGSSPSSTWICWAVYPPEAAFLVGFFSSDLAIPSGSATGLGYHAMAPESRAPWHTFSAYVKRGGGSAAKRQWPAPHGGGKGGGATIYAVPVVGGEPRPVEDDRARVVRRRGRPPAPVRPLDVHGQLPGELWTRTRCGRGDGHARAGRFVRVQPRHGREPHRVYGDHRDRRRGRAIRFLHARHQSERGLVRGVRLFLPLERRRDPASAR